MLLPILMLLTVAAEDPGKCEVMPPNTLPWPRPEEYPDVARERRIAVGPVTYRADVDAEGCVTACAVTESSGLAALDAATCDVLMRRARFKAARNAEGKRVAAAYHGAYWWIEQEPLPPGVTPPEPRQPPAIWVTNDDYPAAALRAEQQGNVGYRLDIDVAGRATGCTIWMSSGSPLLDSTTCSLMKRRARLNPARNAAGEAVPSTWISGIRWRVPD